MAKARWKFKVSPRPTGDTTLARIIRLVAEAQEQKAPTQRFVDVFARYYTPCRHRGGLAGVSSLPPLFMGGDWSVWLYRACVLLIIACPCALVISTPVSIVAGLTALARRGVLVKGGAHLETIGRLKRLAVDKTGNHHGRKTPGARRRVGQWARLRCLRCAGCRRFH
jgi:Cd2+/Zn2+-exporting ATPase